MKRKQFITFVLTALLSIVGARALAHDIEVKNADGVTIYYKWANNKTELSVSFRGFAGRRRDGGESGEYSGNVVIPEFVTYKGTTYPVTSIGNGAFIECSRLTSVTIPNSVTSIGNRAFSDCSSLTSVTIPNSVTSIGSSAFYECSGLTSVTIPNSVTSIGSAAFHETAWFKNQPDGLVYAGKFAYKYKGTMPQNTSISLREGTLEITDNAFIGCSGLTSVTIPNSVTSIGKLAFLDCTGLKSVTIGNSVTSIGENAFSGCKGLTSITIPNSVTSIGENAFSGCKGLTSVTIGNSVTSIDKGTFLGCSGLTSVTIPNSVTSIGQHAFQWCSGLTSVTIGNSVTSIDPSAFSNCPNLQNATVSSSLEKIIADKRIPLFSGTKIKTVTVKNTNGTKKQSNAWYWFDNESPKERAEAAKRAAELARQEAEARKSIDPNSMSWPAPSYDTGWRRYHSDSDDCWIKELTWSSWEKRITILYHFPYKEYLRCYYVTGLDREYKNYQDAEAAAYFWKVHGLKRTRGQK